MRYFTDDEKVILYRVVERLEAELGLRGPEVHPSGILLEEEVLLVRAVIEAEGSLPEDEEPTE